MVIINTFLHSVEIHWPPLTGQILLSLYFIKPSFSSCSLFLDFPLFLTIHWIELDIHCYLLKCGFESFPLWLKSCAHKHHCNELYHNLWFSGLSLIVWACWWQKLCLCIMCICMCMHIHVHSHVTWAHWLIWFLLVYYFLIHFSE